MGLMMDIHSGKIQGLIAALVKAADSGYLSGVRLELKNHEGLVDTLTTDSSMKRSHTEPDSITEIQGHALANEANVFLRSCDEVVH